MTRLNTVAYKDAVKALSEQHRQDLQHYRKQYDGAIETLQAGLLEARSENARLLQAVADGGIRAGKLTARVIDLERRLNPRQWTPAMHDAWHKALPDTQRAFEALAAGDVPTSHKEK